MQAVSTATMAHASDYELQFKPLLGEGLAEVFPCDARGRVDLDRLRERLRDRYFYARTMIGLEYAQPVVCEAHCF